MMVAASCAQAASEIENKASTNKQTVLFIVFLPHKIPTAKGYNLLRHGDLTQATITHPEGQYVQLDQFRSRPNSQHRK
jgi:hypothetical protein